MIVRRFKPSGLLAPFGSYLAFCQWQSNKVLSGECLGTLAECSPVSAAPLWVHTILG